MRSIFCFLVMVFLINVQAHAMWALERKIFKDTPRSWHDDSFRKNNLEGLKEILAGAEERGLNPNTIKSFFNTTVLELACAHDRQGDIVKKLLHYGEIEANYTDQVLLPLRIAANHKNWPVLKIFYVSSLMTLTDGDLE